ncbi:MAG TPA: class I SAM-dependent methyltransferase [Ktedonobacteraceae bacterium]|jgi:2-polyprenyl-3-methyl-5-hydroxy-6-metoxy-1,4-benzoquinol methylase|nr:class I SAM-dependent methyltransferase [Ktedonobacteraceae bacterium]
MDSDQRHTVLDLLVNDYRKDKNARKDLDYDLVTYIKYEYATRADETKKLLELDQVQRILLRFDITMGRSLDIGCATGRYPFWLASRGFKATGYDISEEAINICQKRSVNSPLSTQPMFKLKDITRSEVPSDYFTLVTSMMGTFNHIEPNDRLKFLTRAYQALAQGGLIILSTWNPTCPYPGFLNFYVREEREKIIKCALLPEELLSLLKTVGLINIHVEHFCFLPDICYDAWSPEITEEQIIDVDKKLSLTLHNRNSQMYVIFGQKL